MPEVPLYPLPFEPILRELIWGGRRLGTLLHKPIGSGSDYAESWEISDYHDQVSVVSRGPLGGTTIRELVHTRGQELLGPALAPREQFPLLIKFIDAHQNLSVQVHPDDETARRLADDKGKTETWVIMEAEPGSAIYAGLKQGVKRKEFEAAARAGQVEPLLHRLEPRRGECILIESGTVHAIGAGILLAEIQEMSDTTFRIHDWGRLGTDGKPRALHLDHAMQSINFDRGPVSPVAPEIESIAGGGTREKLSRSPYFALERLTLCHPAQVGDHERFTILMGLEGRSEVHHGGECVRLEFGQTLLLPAAVGPCEITPRDDARVLTCVVP
jgi:mannose-6-phosphate isomerase